MEAIAGTVFSVLADSSEVKLMLGNHSDFVETIPDDESCLL